MRKIFSIYGLACVAVILIIAIAITSSFIHVNMTKKAHVEKAYATVTELASRENIDDLVLTIYSCDSNLYGFGTTKEWINNREDWMKQSRVNKEVLKGEEIRPILESYKQLTPEQIESDYPESVLFYVDSYYIFETEKEGELLSIAVGHGRLPYTDIVGLKYVIINDMCFKDHFNQFTQ